MSNVRKIQEAVERAQQAEADKKAEVSKQIEATKADFEKFTPELTVIKL